MKYESNNYEIGISTRHADYYLMSCSTQYESIFAIMRKKIAVTKYIIRYLRYKINEKPKLSDLIEYIETTNVVKDAEEMLYHNAKFICEEVSILMIFL